MTPQRGMAAIAKLAAVVLAAVTLASCAPAMTQLVRLDLTGKKDAHVGHEWALWGQKADHGKFVFPALRRGSFLWADNFAVPYRLSDGESLRASISTWGMALNGRVVTLDVREDSAMTWLSRASASDMSHLRYVITPDRVRPRVLDALAKLARANATVGLEIESQATLDQVLPLFRPHILSLGDSMRPLARDARQLLEIETLAMSASEPGSLDWLTTLPRLRNLVINNWHYEIAGPLPQGLHGLKSLSAWDLTGKDQLLREQLLANMPAGLEELFVEEITMDQLRRLTKLQRLFLPGNRWLEHDMSELKSLRHLTVMIDSAPGQLKAVVNAHPNLESLTILNDLHDSPVVDLSPLAEAKRLQTAVLMGRFSNLGVLRSMTSLRYVALPEALWEDAPDVVASISEALPAAAVVPIAPFCLGSGWILLLPAMVMLATMATRSRRATSTN